MGKLNTRTPFEKSQGEYLENVGKNMSYALEPNFMFIIWFSVPSLISENLSL